MLYNKVGFLSLLCYTAFLYFSKSKKEKFRVLICKIPFILIFL